MWGQADMLLLAMGYDPDPGQLCLACGIINVSCEQPNGCSKCGNKGMREISIKEEMVRMAERTGCQVEVVGDSDILMRFGGVGCLLRYPKPQRSSEHRIDQ
jgi:peptide subunit release factor 1 (eRF1)